MICKTKLNKVEKINQTKSESYKKFNKVNKSQDRLSKKQVRQNKLYQKGKGISLQMPKTLKDIVRLYYKQLYKSDNLDKMDQFFKNHKLCQVKQVRQKITNK